MLGIDCNKSIYVCTFKRTLDSLAFRVNNPRSISRFYCPLSAAGRRRGNETLSFLFLPFRFVAADRENMGKRSKMAFFGGDNIFFTSLAIPYPGNDEVLSRLALNVRGIFPSSKERF